MIFILGLPIPPRAANPPRNIYMQRQLPSHMYGDVIGKATQDGSFSSQQVSVPNNRSQPYNQQYSHLTSPLNTGSNWRDHLTPSATSQNPSPNVHPPNSMPENIARNLRVPNHGGSPSLSSSSDQRSVGSGKRYPTPPSKPLMARQDSQPGSAKISISTPPVRDNSRMEDIKEDEDESDWEKEISEQGDVFYVVPYMQTDSKIGDNSDQASSLQKNEMFSGNKDSSVNGVNKTGGKKLSRLVRRRESKRDRSSSGANPGPSPKSTEKHRIAEKSEMSNKDNLENNPKSISLLPGGIMHSNSTSFIQANNR